MEVYANKGVFHPKERISLTIKSNKKCHVFITITSLDKDIGHYEYDCSVGENNVKLPNINCKFKGFGVKCIDENGNEAYCSFDVQEKIKAFRYGFLSDFSPIDGDQADVQSMAKHHINAVQFYDWSYRHDMLVSPTKEYKDMMGKTNSLSIIKNKIQSCHDYNMKAIGYGAVYAASKKFALNHQDWQLYENKKPLEFINVFSIMNLRSGFMKHIIGEYRKAISFGFDGIHMDTYGFPKTAYDYLGKVIHLEEDFVKLIRQVRKTLPNNTFVFNNVGAWPLELTMKEDVDAVYIEAWPPYEKYNHLREIINLAKKSKKAVVIAAYPAAFRNSSKAEALNSQIILSCIFASHGVTQLWFGEENAAITQGYYADYSKLTKKQEIILRRYDDFFVRYEELLFDDNLQNVSMTHFGWDNLEYRCSVPSSVTGEVGKLWLIIHQKPGRQIISIINLINEKTDIWSKGHKVCKPVNNVYFDVQVFGKIKKILSASPDYLNGNLYTPDYSLVRGQRGMEAHIKISNINRFAMIIIETQE